MISYEQKKGKNKYSASKIVDGKYDTYFASSDNSRDVVLEFILDKPSKIDGFILQEYIPLGQRVEEYSIECMVNGEWEEVFSGKHIGYKRIILSGEANCKDITFPKTDKIRLKMNDALASPLINNFQIISL